MARKRGMQYIPYDYEAAYNKAMEDMHEWFIENLFQHRKKVIYALKEITAGDQFEIEIYPQFRSIDEVPPEGRTIKKDNNKAHIALIAVLLTGFCVILFNVKEPEQQEEKPETTQAEVIQNPETMTQMTESIEDKYKVFDTMSEDWGSDDLEGFVFYDLPEKYADKGYFPEKMQICDIWTTW